MAHEALLNERLDRLEAQIASLTQSARVIKDLRDELSPRINEAVQALITELADLEPDFQLEDLIILLKNMLRNVKNLNFTLDQLKNLIDFATIAEPVVKTTVPQIIYDFDDLERRGVFRLVSTGLDVLKQVGSNYSEEEMRQMGDGLATLIGCLQQLTTPDALRFLEKAAGLPAQVDLAAARPVGMWGLLGALMRPEVREGMGVALELTSALGRLKG